MKKIFQLRHPKKNPDRLIDAIKYEIKKYLKRERGKKLPEDATYWDFDCQFGKNSEDTSSLGASQIGKALDAARAEEWEACYIEILAKAVYKNKDED